MTPSRPAADDAGARPRWSTLAAASGALRVGRIEAWVGGAVVCGIALVLAILLPAPWEVCCLTVGAIAIVCTVVESAVVVPIAVRNFRVEIVPTGVVVYRGALFRSVDHIPAGKITVVRRQTGPLLRRLGVAKCVVFTPAREIVLLPMSVDDVERLMELGHDDV